MTAEELFDLRSHPKSAIDVTGWLLSDCEIKAAIRFERDNPGLDMVGHEEPAPDLRLSNGL